MRLDTFIRKSLRLKAHRVVKIEADEAAKELVIHLDVGSGKSGPEIPEILAPS